MNLTLKNQVNLISALIISIFLTISCDAWVTLSGKVLDEYGNPLSDAKIVVEQGKSKVVETKSQNDGSYNLHENVAPNPPFFDKIKLTVSKDGYQIYTLELDKLNKEINITLKKN